MNNITHKHWVVDVNTTMHETKMHDLGPDDNEDDSYVYG